jgi:hypothetical protein
MAPDCGVPDTCRYVITLSAAKSRDVVIFTSVHWTAKQRQIALGSILLAPMPNENYLTKLTQPRKEAAPYLIEIWNDTKHERLVLTAFDWTEDERRTAVNEISRLAGAADASRR